jgi:uncharacterized RDD family membrane protein YckC
MLPNFRTSPEGKKEASPARDELSGERGKFVPDGGETDPDSAGASERLMRGVSASEPPRSAPEESKQAAVRNPDEWREEVAARLSRYREKRQPRAPRYPSLTLKFETPEPSPVVESSIAEPEFPPQGPVEEESPSLTVPVYELPPDAGADAHETAKIIEFPRPWVPQARPADELAEPVMDRPRILEVPESLPPPPALGGMLIEDVQEASRERRPGLDIPLQAAPLSHRLLAGAVDALLVVCSFAAFGCVAFRITAVTLSLQQWASASAALLWLFWAGYEYLMTVYTGSTPGLKFTKLQLSRFDGTPAPRKIRKWRALASILSAASVGLGYAWCFLDEDGLCWHDRITKTYIAPQASKTQARPV